MIEVRRTLKTESLFMSATIMSVLIHCMIASFLFFCIRAKPMESYIPKVISVDIMTLEPEQKETPHANLQSQTRPDVKLHPEPLTRIIPLQVRKPVQLQVKEPSSVPFIAGPTVKALPNPPFQERNISLDKALSPQGVTNTADMTLLDKSGPSRRAKAVDIHVSQSYLAALKDIIEKHKEYPLMARRGRMEGTVRISCKLTRTGEMRESIIAASSGYEILDKAALRAVRSVGQFPVVPSEIKAEPFCFIAPITFHLARE
jgi:protein TonB